MRPPLKPVHTERLLVLAAAVLVLLPQPPPSTADDLARAIQTKYDRVIDWSADFVHSYRGGMLRTEAVERGEVKIKRPGQMRWIYQSPERKEFVSDGVRIYAYIPADRQVIISLVPAADEATTPALFLAGKGSVTRDFVASIPDPADAAPGSSALKLTPKQHQAEYDWIVVEVDPQTRQVRRLVTLDAQGGRSTFLFSHVRENVGLPNSEFLFIIPRGVDVITDGQARD